ncbi:MAG: MXAN_5187 C-terminal domain-containing protein [Acidobacteriota bacterium]
MAENEPKQRVDYSQVRVIGNEDTVKTQKMMAQLGTLFERVKREYDLWFYGTNPKPPYELRNQLDNLVRRFRNKMPTRTADNFKVAALMQKYVSHAELWDKSVRKQEEGGKALWMSSGHRSALEQLQEENERRQEEGGRKAQRPNQSKYLARITAGEGDGEEMKRLFNSYVIAKKRCGEDVGEGSFDKFRQALDRQSRGLIDSGQAKAVAYRIEVTDDGRVAIKAKPES